MPLFATFGGASGKRFGLTSSTRFDVSGGTRTEQTISGVPYTFFTFTSPGTLTISGGGSVPATIVAVRAGFPGSAGSGTGGTGGAGGGLTQANVILREGTHAVNRGAAPGGPSSVTIPYGTPIVASNTGGSGGAGGLPQSPAGNGSPGGAGPSTDIFGTPVNYGGGGGGGAGANPGNAGAPSYSGGAGGATGGASGGSSYTSISYPPPLTGVPPFPFADGSPGGNATPNTGGGGGGGSGAGRPGGAGAPGIVIIRFRTSDLKPA